jgi:hypothetical protein
LRKFVWNMIKTCIMITIFTFHNKRQLSLLIDLLNARWCRC